MMLHTSKIVQCLILTKINIAINQTIKLLTIKLLTIKLFYAISFIFLLLYKRKEFSLSYLFLGATEIIQK